MSILGCRIEISTPKQTRLCSSAMAISHHHVRHRRYFSHHAHVPQLSVSICILSYSRSCISYSACNSIMRLTNRLLSILMIGLTALTFAVGFACGTVTWIWVRTYVATPPPILLLQLISVLLRSSEHSICRVSMSSYLSGSASR